MSPLELTLLTAMMAGGDECCSRGEARPWAGYNQGVKWTRSLEDAIEEGAIRRKVIVLFQLVGDLDKEGT